MQERYVVVALHAVNNENDTPQNIAQVLASCRETFGDRSSVAKFSTRQSVNPSIKNPAFISALNAIRQRH